jgi:hypothetical protein
VNFAFAVNKTFATLNVGIDSQEIFKMRVRAKRDVSITDAVEVAKAASVVGNTTFAIWYNSANYNVSLSYTILGNDPEPPMENEPAPYTVSAVSSTTSAVAPVAQASGEPFTVDIVVNSTVTDATFAAMDTTVTYNSNVVELTSVTGADINVEVTHGTGSVFINRTGSATSLTAGATVATLTFAPLAAGDAEITIVTPHVGLSGATEALTGADAATPGTPLVITITEPIPAVTDSATLSAYAGSPSGYKLLKFVPATDAGAYKYGAEQMFWSSKLNAYLYIVNDATEADALAKVTADGTNIPLSYDGKINSDDAIDIFDAQVVYDLANNHLNYTGDTTFSYLSIRKRLEADINGSGDVTEADARAIQYYTHHIGSFGA